jgi:hypothetical protein
MFAFEYPSISCAMQKRPPHHNIAANANRFEIRLAISPPLASWMTGYFVQLHFFFVEPKRPTLFGGW